MQLCLRPQFLRPCAKLLKRVWAKSQRAPRAGTPGSKRRVTMSYRVTINMHFLDCIRWEPSTHDIPEYSLVCFLIWHVKLYIIT
jgi:hypothetical protein